MNMEMNDILRVQHDKALWNQFVADNEAFILKIASSTARRYIMKSDDEWSAGLEGFVQAIREYRPGTGNFEGFAALLIRRRVIDCLRAHQKFTAEIPIDPILFETPPEEDGEELPLRMALSEKLTVLEQDALRLEIESVEELFRGYSFTFFDLAKSSPKAEKTKRACAAAVRCLLENPILLGEMRRSAQLPVKILEKNLSLPRKILERHRRYIIAAAEILSGEYPCLGSYLSAIGREPEK